MASQTAAHLQKDAMALLRGLTMVARELPLPRITPPALPAEFALPDVTTAISAATGAASGATAAVTSHIRTHTLNAPIEGAVVSPSVSPLELSKTTDLKEQFVPASRVRRAVGFAGMAAGMVGSAVGTLLTGQAVPSAASASALVPKAGPGSAVPAMLPTLQAAFLTESNADRLAEELCRMRGAALKLAQMVSIQDERQVPPVLAAALERVRAAAHVMPSAQLNGALEAELGSEWKGAFAEFDEAPFAAASIGQVHAGQLTEEFGAFHTVTKVQYPGVAGSIDSDVRNLTMLLGVTDALPRGLFAEHAVDTMREELAEECDFRLEAKRQADFSAAMARHNTVVHDAATSHNGSHLPPDSLFRLPLGCQGVPGVLPPDHPLLASLPLIHVPAVVPEASSRGVLTTTFAPGTAIDTVASQPQAVRDAVGTALLGSVMQQLFVLGSMQTDPNWGNYLYDPRSHVLTMIDFGALRSYDSSFVTRYRDVVWAAAERDEPAMLAATHDLGFLTGHEAPDMVRASVASGMIVGDPFSERPGYAALAPGDPRRYDPEFAFDFGTSDMTLQVAEFADTMAYGRLAPPPPEAYSLHRILSGAFLTCMKIGARVPARAVLEDVFAQADALQR